MQVHLDVEGLMQNSNHCCMGIKVVGTPWPVAQLVGASSVYQKDLGSIFSQDTYLGVQFNHHSGHEPEAIHRCFSIISLSLSLSLSLISLSLPPPSLSLVDLSSGEDFF